MTEASACTGICLNGQTAVLVPRLLVAVAVVVSVFVFVVVSHRL